VDVDDGGTAAGADEVGGAFGGWEEAALRGEAGFGDGGVEGAAGGEEEGEEQEEGWQWRYFMRGL
jgi:hypothetical protein